MNTLPGYYELEPEDCTFTDVTADVTHQCNMTCSNCYIPNRDVPDMDIDKFIECISKFPKRTMIRIMGAEPTMRDDLVDIIKRIKQAKHRCTLLTNGLKLASMRYTQSLKDAKLSHVYLSLNGVDNDDWYEAIDELRCAKLKVKALSNIKKANFIVDTGTILCKGINDDAPSRLLHLFKQLEIEHAMIRFKNVGQHGRYLLESVDNWKLDDMIRICSEHFGVSVDYINSWRDKPIYGNHVEEDTFMFPIDPNSETKMLHRSGYWVKLADWDSHDDTRLYPFMNQTRRGRITEDFKVAPLPAHIVANEGGY